MSAQPQDLDAQMQEIEWSDDIDMEDVHAVPLPVLPQTSTGPVAKPAVPTRPTTRATLELDAVDATDILNGVSIPIPPVLSHQPGLVLGISVPAGTAHTATVVQGTAPLLGIPLPDSTSFSTLPSNSTQHAIGIALPIPFHDGLSGPTHAPLGVAVSLEPAAGHSYPDLHSQVSTSTFKYFDLYGLTRRDYSMIVSTIIIIVSIILFQLKTSLSWKLQHYS